jgi:hypothetical protein
VEARSIRASRRRNRNAARRTLPDLTGNIASNVSRELIRPFSGPADSLL